jgi:two-component system phosphate regulon response regulator PhoB
MASILVVDDEQDLLDLVKFHLAKEKHKVYLALTGLDGLRVARNKRPDLIILDVMLPDITGTEVCKNLRGDRRTKDIPVLFLSARGEEIDRVVGFEVGGDDYVTKPFSPREVVLRVRSILARSAKKRDDLVSTGKINLDLDAHRVVVENKEIHLTATEFRLLQDMIENIGRVRSREVLISVALGSDAVVTDRTIDTHIARLRGKLGEEGKRIETVRGVGYRFEDGS